MSASASATSYTCLGTRMVVLTSEGETKNPLEGLLAVYQRQPSSSSSSSDEETERRQILIRLGTDVASYKVKIPYRDVKLPEDQKDQIPNFLLQDGSKHEHILVSFQFDKSSDPGAKLKLVIQQRIQQWGTLKFIFQDELTKEQSLLGFCATLGEAINDGQAKIAHLTEELTSAQKGLSDWKDTAQELETRSREEKQKILQNTLLAWQQNQQRHKDHIADLDEQLARAKRQLESRPARRQQHLLDAPDDLDAIISNEQTLEDDTTAQALAAGRRVEPPARKPILDPSETINKADMERDRKEYEQQKKRKAQPKRAPRKKTAPPPETASDESSPPTTPKPAKRQRKAKRPELSSPSPPSDASGTKEAEADENGYNSEEERMRMAIRNMVQTSRLNNDDDDDSDTDVSS
eukprot:scaffold8136_cov127-Cylindrotheca_fusiformis.AAC.17